MFLLTIPAYFLLAVLLHSLLVRTRLPGSSVFKFFAVGGTAGLCMLGHLLLLEAPTLGILAALAAYAFLCELYLFLFTMVMTSVSVRMLRLLLERDRTHQEIDAAYDSRAMVERRLERMRVGGLLEGDDARPRITPRAQRLVALFLAWKRFFRHPISATLAATGGPEPEPPPEPTGWAARIAPWLVLLAVPVILFRGHLSGQSLFIGNSDRLNSMLNVAAHHAHTLEQGRLDAWNEGMFAGSNTFGLPYTFPHPFLFVELIGGEGGLFIASGIVACLLLTLAGWTAFLFIRAVTGCAFVSTVGACLYELSALATLKISQNDMSFAVLISIPLVLFFLRRVARGRTLGSFIGLAAILGFMLGFMFLQKVIYAMLIAGFFAAYRSVWLRDLRPLAVLAAATLTAGVLAFPRIYTVGEEVALLSRTQFDHEVESFEGLYEHQFITPIQLLRLLDDGIFGRLPAESSQQRLNHTEGMLLYTSIFAIFLLLLGLLRHRGGWLRIWFFRDEDSTWLLLCFLLGCAVIALKPVGEFMFELFLRKDFTHARIIVATLLPLCTLVALVLRDWAPGAYGRPARITLRTLLVGGFVAAVVVTAARLAGGSAGVHLGEMGGKLVDSLAKRARLGKDVPLEIAHATWCCFFPLAVMIFLKMCQVLFARSPLGRPRFQAWTLGITLGVSATLLLGLQHQGWSGGRWILLEMDETLHGSELFFSRRVVHGIEWSLLVFIGYVGVYALFPRSAPRYGVVGGARPVIAAALGVSLVLDALFAADFRMNGIGNEHARMPFDGGNSMVARDGQFTLPGPDALAAFQERLETNEYRSVVVASPKQFPVFCAAHVSSFWRLRLLDGYSSGVPKPLSALNWPLGTVTLRAISFSDKDALPWPLLSLGNVKYALVISPGFFWNRVEDGAGGRDALPRDIEIVENPLPVTPRHFLASSVREAEDLAEAAQHVGGAWWWTDVTKVSIAEGRGIDGDYDATGSLHVEYRGDHIDVNVTPSAAPRFVVLNELHHPRWHAFHEGGELPVYRANGFMRGIVIPPGVEQVSLRFVPFVCSKQACWFYAGGVLLLGSGIWFWRRADRKAVVAAQAHVLPQIRAWRVMVEQEEVFADRRQWVNKPGKPLAVEEAADMSLQYTANNESKLKSGER